MITRLRLLNHTRWMLFLSVLALPAFAGATSPVCRSLCSAPNNLATVRGTQSAAPGCPVFFGLPPYAAHPIDPCAWLAQLSNSSRVVLTNPSSSHVTARPMAHFLGAVKWSDTPVLPGGDPFPPGARPFQP